MKLLVASRNAGKLREIRGLLGPEGIEALGLADLPGAVDVDEDGDTFLANARKKAQALSAATGLPVLADDSGLVVEALGGRPGVWSARFAGPGATDDANNRKLLDELAGVAEDARSAAFVCVMVLAVPGDGERTAEGKVEGRILAAPRGDQGFGYDPLFLVAGTDRTLAEMPLDEKNAVSHRARALRAILHHVLALRGA